MDYLIKSVFCLALFYPFYMVLLSRETFHRFNRLTLIGILLASAIIPLCRMTTKEPVMLSQIYQRWEHWLTGKESAEATISVDFGTTEMEIVSDTTTDGAVIEDYIHPIHWTEVFFLFYVGGILFRLGRNCFSIYRLTCLLRSGRTERMDNGVRLVLHLQPDIAPFSWMHYIVISEQDYRESGKQILAHEQAHISNGHSWDLLWVELCILVQWFNPIVWLIRRELQNIHEYEADEAVIKQGIDAKQYQLLIIKKAVGARLYSLANNLNHSSLKKRLTMMMKEKSHPWARLKYLYVLPLAAISVVAFAHPEAVNNSNGTSEAKVTVISANGQTSDAKMSENEGNVPHIVSGDALPTSTVQNENDEVFMVVEQMPEYPGGMGELMKFLQKNIKYPAQAHKDSIQGRVIVQFVIDKTGKVTDPVIKKSVSPELDAEAIRVVNAMPLWTPGRQRGKAVSVKFTLPIQFRLQGKEALQKQVANETLPTPNVQVTSKGEYLYGHNGTMQKGSLEEVANYVNDVRKEVNSAGKGAHFKVQLVADKDAPQESVDKLKEALRKIHVLQINYHKVSDEVFMVVEKMPEFPGGPAEMMKYLQQNISYPKEAHSCGISGRVIVQFIVDKSGELRDFEIKRSISPELDAEALRVVRQMPKWTPGTQRGKAVNVRYTLPVSFKLQ
ncbi:MAG: M56 family metallopeptidase [Bacteroidaceae bacterium]|nr:M56 family metallopeptidase [Bacteroidaceae bacterium]